MGQSGGRGAVSWLQASRYADEGRRHSRASWRFGAAFALASWLSQQSCALARCCCKTGAALPRCVSGLRGYGDSSLPDPGARLINYSHRVMAEDMIEAMEQLGHQRFFLIGHDRGARVSHRMCLDHPERVMKLCLLDMLPTYYVWTNTTREWALGTWHWAFLAQPEPFPQTMINAVTPEWFLTNRGGIPRQRPKIVMNEFIRCFTPKTISGACRDYRAGAT